MGGWVARYDFSMRLSLFGVIVSAGLAGCGHQKPAASNPPSSAAIHQHAPENVLVASPGVISGGEPASDAELDWLRDQGIRTIISVDGKQPDAEGARARGMRYVHIPLQYRGVPIDRRRAITKAIRDLPGPVYVHCHHGKHRGPAATAAALVCLGRLTPEEGTEFLNRSGTSPNYRGLFADVAGSTVIPSKELDELRIDFPERAPIGSLVEAMSEIDRAIDRLDSVRKTGWKTPANHPDLHAPDEATIVAEAFRELSRLDATRHSPEDYRNWFAAAETAADQMRAGLKGSRPAAEIDVTWKTLKQTCIDCHARYRDFVW